METLNTIVLLSGVAITLDKPQSVVLPEVSDVEVGETVRLENSAHEYIGVAEVTHKKVLTFALVQKEDLVRNAHPGMGTWHDALSVLASQVPEFSQLDKVTIVSLYPQAVTGVGLDIEIKEPVEVDETEEIPSEDEQYAALDEVAE